MSRRRVAVLMLAILLPRQLPARDETAILREIQAYFRARDESGAALSDIVERIRSDPSFDRSALSTWLHRAELFHPQEPGRKTLAVARGAAAGLPIVVRVPERYDPRRPWPLIYALHGTGGSGDDVIAFVERLLGERVEQFVVAAPSGYAQVIVHATEPYADEHAAAIRAVRQAFHIDGDRVYALGYSRGGHACWTLAVLNADQFAGVVPLAGALILQEYEKLYEVFLPNVATTRVLCCWGAGDTSGVDAAVRSPQDGIAGLNRVLLRVADRLSLPVTGIEDPERGHGGVTPPAEALAEVLAARRGPWPRKFEHTFRVLDQGSSQWIGVHAVAGAVWNGPRVKVEFRPGENPGDPAVEREALARAIRGLLCRVQGEIDGQTLRVVRKNVTHLTVWIGDGMIDWTQPIVLSVNGEKAFEGRVEPNLSLCLERAKQTYDFERLVWAGLRFKSGQKATVIRGLHD